MIVEVTGEDIAKGLAGIPEACPVALALHRIRGVRTGEVWPDQILLVTRAGRVIHYDTPRRVCEFVIAFDIHGSDKVEPFAFELDIDPWWREDAGNGVKLAAEFDLTIDVRETEIA